MTANTKNKEHADWVLLDCPFGFIDVREAVAGVAITLLIAFAPAVTATVWTSIFW